ncbi:TlpA family protein disulfide reductase [Flavobacterium terrigena]|uniref:Thioredoxin-like n=1 Tax=Flavobacterium terrigena TaxID=402734 RepID=A0A1H6QC33_9FLAO|nr:thioredoxin-like domain-containing protein [Flavobacterium terrigena]SEI39406.1 Thioredoxin-like [Flavobacterium terrigena]
MLKKYSYINFILLSILLTSMTSCKDGMIGGNQVAYFGGEIENPKSNFIVFMKNDKVIDTFYLDKENRFFHKFDSLTPGLYSFKDEAEYQYVFFDKNDSIMVRLNSNDFDNTLMFCGRGDEKNNFMMELFLKDENLKNNMFGMYEKDEKFFSKYIDSSYQNTTKLYNKRKSFINWSEEFDEIAKANIELNYAYKKEIYPIIYEFKTGKSIKTNLPKSYYSYRKKIDVNKPSLLHYIPFINYMTSMLNNIVLTDSKGHLDDMSLENNIKKLQIADTLIRDKHVKDLVINNVANMYLLSDQCSINNGKFFSLYSKIVSDPKLKADVMQTAETIKKLKCNSILPDVTLFDVNNKPVKIKDLLTKKTIIYFWTKQAESHAIYSHKKVDELKTKYPDIQFIAVNIHNSQNDWVKEIKEKNFTNSIELRAPNFEELKDKWVINKVYRTMLINKNGSINNAFVSMFDANFESYLK